MDTSHIFQNVRQTLSAESVECGLQAMYLNISKLPSSVGNARPKRLETACLGRMCFMLLMVWMEQQQGFKPRSLRS